MILPAVLLSLLTLLTQDGWNSQFRQCAQETDPQIRLACYDALDRHLNRNAPGTSHEAPGHSHLTTTAQTDTPPASAFELHRDASGDLTLTRALWPAGQLTIACIKNITYLRLRLPQPWQGGQVITRMNGVNTRSDWFIRDNGSLLEYGRGLPAISALKSWLDQQEIHIDNDHGQSVTVPLSGLRDAITPLRQQCRWQGETHGEP